MISFTKQKGLSSVEMVLVLPIFLLFFALIANAGKFWHVKLDNNINARTEAWREAMFDSLPDDFCEPIEDQIDVLRDNDQLSVVFRQEQLRRATNSAITPFGNSLACKGNNKNDQDYRRSSVVGITLSDDNLGSKARGYRSGLYHELNKTSEQPYAVTGRAYYLWADWKIEDKHVFLMEDYHVIDVNGSYQRVDMPYGHDDHIERFLIQR